MRKTATGKVRVRAISGTSVVFLAFDMTAKNAEGLMGFAIQRHDLTEAEVIWLRGNKTFPSVRQSVGISDATSFRHPFQDFQWADYAAKPAHHYRYRVMAMYGPPENLEPRWETEIDIETEPLGGDTHSVYFNRGAIASQAFAQRFPGLTLDQAGEPAYQWLARDLLPGLLDFISRAEGDTWSLHVAIFEMRWPAVLDALRAASKRKVNVRILYHAKDDETGTNNKQEITQARLRSLSVPRRNTKLMHNKFIVLSHEGKPVSVWLGSTNWSRNAFFGQLNVGHSIDDGDLSRQFLGYWTALSKDPTADELKDWAEQNNPPRPKPDVAPLTAVFSPTRGRSVWNEWIELASTRNAPLFMTFPFGIVKDFRPVFDQADNVLRFALLDKYTNGGSSASRAAVKAEIEKIRRRANVGMALGARIFVDWIDGWMVEPSALGVNVNWVHTKFMLIDPLGENPVTLTGSANWSEASVNDNDEHLVVIRGNQRVADIYFGEFMRIFAHHRFRESVARHLDELKAHSENSWKPSDLFEDPKDWVPKHFRKNSEHDIKRRYFSGQ